MYLYTLHPMKLVVSKSTEPSWSQSCLYALNPLKLENFKLNWPSCSQMCYLHLQIDQIIPSSILMCLCTLEALKLGHFQLKWPSLLSNIYTYIQPAQFTHNCIKYAIKHYKHIIRYLQPSNMRLYTHIVPISKSPNLWTPTDVPKTCTNAPPTWNIPKAPPNLQVLKISQPTNNQISNSMTCMNGPHNLLNHTNTRDQIA